MTCWTIFKDPEEFPGEIIARKFNVDGDNIVPTQDVIRCKPAQDVSHMTPEAFEQLQMQTLRSAIWARVEHAVCFPRSDKDDPAVVETWM